jgi:5-oxopent-3-ene-1,2,5-tricarboxylate decarboxylase/2-hydroxyhepta-2,4-diene-1,7-dioate isomerase
LREQATCEDDPSCLEGTVSQSNEYIRISIWSVTLASADREFIVSERTVRVMAEPGPSWGRLDGGDVVLRGGGRIPLEEARFLAPVVPSKIAAVHLTYRSRVDEYEAQVPPYPSFFLKPPTALNGHLRPIQRPAGTRFLNYEGELAVVVGRRMKGVPQDRALDYVAGYACANDVGLHDFRHADRGSMLRVKGQDGFLPLGPELVPAAEFDPASFTLRTSLNGEVVQEATADDLIWSVAYQLADLCRLITLEPGDVLLTGTPANSRPMEAGDTVAVEISGLGRLENTVEDWDVDLTEAGEQPQTSAQTLHVALAIPESEAEEMVEAKPEGGSR